MAIRARSSVTSTAIAPIPQEIINRMSFPREIVSHFYFASVYFIESELFQKHLLSPQTSRDFNNQLRNVCLAMAQIVMALHEHSLDMNVKLVQVSHYGRNAPSKKDAIKKKILQMVPDG